MIARVKSVESEEADDSRVAEEHEWYNEEQFDNWKYSGTNESWASMIKDLPDPVSLIQKLDDDGIEWLTLNNSRSWDEPKDIGKEKYEYKLLKHDVYLATDAILVKATRQREGNTVF